MNGKSGLITALVAGALISLAVIGTSIVRAQHPTRLAHNYRLSVDIKVDGKPHMASQTYAYDCGQTFHAPQGSLVANAPCELYGRAIRVDLGSRGSLFVLMTGWNEDRSGFSGANSMVRRLLFVGQHGAMVPITAMPVMVRFQNPTDPDSVQIVDPAHLGSGVQLESMTIDFNNGIETPSDIDQALPWLTSFKGGELSAKRGNLAHRLHGFDFEWPPTQ